jgi:hypothetical protein
MPMYVCVCVYTHTIASSDGRQASVCECCEAFLAARSRLVEVAPQTHSKRREVAGRGEGGGVAQGAPGHHLGVEGSQGKGRGEGGGALKCQHVVFPECSDYQYVLSPGGGGVGGGDRVTVVAEVRNALTEKMMAVSLCLSVVGARTDSRSCQAMQIAPGPLTPPPPLFFGCPFSPLPFPLFLPVAPCIVQLASLSFFSSLSFFFL